MDAAVETARFPGFVAVAQALERAMRSRDEKLMEVGVLVMIGRTALPIGLTLLLTRALFGHPARLTRPLVGTSAGVLLLAAAASRLDDARFLTRELVRGLAFAAMVIA